ncbi:MAG: glycerol-3-phosphate dehydrogenase/oxidase [Burkholderiaceae bacterium]|nr:glycerol-3-phosphate dehydrogenase/oxidase [Burkholderiaceae bacterium]
MAEVIERERLLGQLREAREWDVLVIGGGATGLGIALDAASRGFRTALIDARDFAGGTSSRSTKLIHGGVRYLAQGNVKLVREALAERALLLSNAGGLVHPLKFVVPCYRPFERELLRVGLGAYDALAGKRGIGDTHWLSRSETTAALPGVKTKNLQGGVAYWDAQFDDARLAIALMRTAVRLGAVAINYVEAHQIALESGRLSSIIARDVPTGERFEMRAKAVFNATGVWADDVRRRVNGSSEALLTLSRGSHIVLPGSYLPASTAMMIPRTPDRRVLFAIPWHGHAMLGTTDVVAERPSWNPQASAAEIDFILDTAHGYFETPPSVTDVVATFAGLRPLFSPRAARATRTISREHAIVIEHGNLLTVVGGKWTTYRRMALDAIDLGVQAGLLEQRPSRTAKIKLDVDASIEAACDAARAASLVSVDDQGNNGAVKEFVTAATRYEQALYADDVISRRLRVDTLDQATALRIRPQVERLLR